MMTRIELWEQYREEIESNINLQKAVKNSNEKLGILYKRLIAAFPEYESKYKVKSITINPDTVPVESAPQYENIELTKILSNIKDDEVVVDFSHINNLDFSAHDLDDVVEEIKSHRSHRVTLTLEPDNPDLVVNQLKEVTLDTKQEKGDKMKKKVTVAIDGPSGSGKSTVAKALAKKYDLNYINTGLVYRAIALNAINKNIDLTNKDEIINTLNDISIKLLPNEEVELNGSVVTRELRADKVSQAASKVSIVPAVRTMAVSIQKDYGAKPGSIMDGRDTTFVVMPNADVRVFLDSKPETRAQRRLEQNKELGYSTDYEQILREIKERDKRDIERKTDPLHVADGVDYIDASDMNVEEVVSEISKLIEKQGR